MASREYVRSRVEPLVNESTGKMVVPVPLRSPTIDEVIISVIPDSGRQRIEMCDEYADREWAYYALRVSKPSAIDLVVTPVTDDGTVGCQHVVEFPGVESSRHWSEQDNQDNAEGRAFRSWAIEFDAPAVNRGFGFTLVRKVKYYQSIREPVDGPGGRFDRSKTLRVRIVARPEMSFEGYVAARLLAD